MTTKFGFVGGSEQPAPKTRIEIPVYPWSECAGCHHLLRDDGTETVGHFVNNGDPGVGLSPSAGCFRTDCKCPGPSVELTEAEMAALYGLKAAGPATGVG